MSVQPSIEPLHNFSAAAQIKRTRAGVQPASRSCVRMLLVRVTAEPAQRALAVVAEPLNRESLRPFSRPLPPCGGKRHAISQSRATVSLSSAATPTRTAASSPAPASRASMDRARSSCGGAVRFRNVLFRAGRSNRSALKRVDGNGGSHVAQTPRIDRNTNWRWRATE